VTDDRMIWVRAPQGTDELNESTAGAFHRHENGLFRIPASMLPPLAKFGGCIEVPEAEALALFAAAEVAIAASRLSAPDAASRT
jgi:hypothetical protein